MNSEEVRDRLLSKRGVRHSYRRSKLRSEIADQIVKLRTARGMSQAQIAALVGTQQPGIARAESGDHLPSLSFLEKLAEAFDVELKAPEFGESYQEVFTTKFVVDISTPCTVGSATHVILTNSGWRAVPAAQQSSAQTMISVGRVAETLVTFPAH